MAGTSHPTPVVINGTASDFAFKLGQTIERLVLRKAVERASQRKPPGSKPVVTIDDVRASLDASLLEALHSQIGGSADVETGEQRAVPI